jgi:hypothetical protein
MVRLFGIFLSPNDVNRRFAYYLEIIQLIFVLFIANQLSFMIHNVVFPVLLENGTTFPKFSFAKRCKPPFCILPRGQSANFRTPYGQSVEFCVISFLGIPLKGI